jgi:hypothetical protein
MRVSISQARRYVSQAEAGCGRDFLSSYLFIYAAVTAGASYEVAFKICLKNKLSKRRELCPPGSGPGQAVHPTPPRHFVARVKMVSNLHFSQPKQFEAPWPSHVPLLTSQFTLTTSYSLCVSQICQECRCDPTFSHEAARYSGVDVIVTRNTADFKISAIPVQLPETLLQE